MVTKVPLQLLKRTFQNRRKKHTHTHTQNAEKEEEKKLQTSREWVRFYEWPNRASLGEK